MLSEKIKTEVTLANKLRSEFQTLIYQRGECKPDERGVQMLAYWALSIDYHCAILALLEQELLGSAFALVRPIIEVTVRAHIVLMCTAQELTDIRNDNYRVNFKEIGPKIDAFFGLGNLMNDFLTAAAKSLHSYTHAGQLAVQRRFDGGDLKPLYRDGEIEEVIHTATSAMFMVTNLMTKHLRFEDEWESVTRMYIEWGKH